MKPIRTLAALLIGAIALSTPSYAGDKPMVSATDTASALKDLEFRNVSLTVTGAPEQAFNKKMMAELQTRATLTPKGVDVTGKIDFVKNSNGIAGSKYEVKIVGMDTIVGEYQLPATNMKGDVLDGTTTQIMGQLEQRYAMRRNNNGTPGTPAKVTGPANGKPQQR